MKGCMRKLRLTLFGIVFALCPCVAHAQDGFVEWLDRLSGPGPFYPRYPGLDLRVRCGLNNGLGWFLECASNGDDVKWYWSLTAVPSTSSTRDEQQFNESGKREIKAQVFETFVRWRLRVGLEIGFGAGATRFFGDLPGGADSFSFFTGELIPVSISVKPFVFLFPANCWARTFSITNDEAYRVGTIRSEDFGGPKGFFSRGNEWNVRWKGSFDITEAFNKCK